MRALITNDDGIDAPGIRALAAAAVDAGLDIVVAAPSWDSSGASASLTAVESEGRLLIAATALEDLPGVPAYGVEAAPAYIVRAAVHGAFGARPDLVLSGINRGYNTGHAVLHSGTVGAALTASTFGTSAAAFSVDARGPAHWETAQAVAREVIAWMVDRPGHLVLNVNVPGVELDDLQGLEEATLSPFGAVQTTVTEVGEGYVRLAYHDLDETAEAGTDSAWLRRGYACFTALEALREAVGTDTTGLARGLARR